MNVMGPENPVGNSRGRARGRTGAIQYNQKAVQLIPKYRIPESRHRLVNLAPSTSNPSTSKTPRSSNRRGDTTSTSSARRTTPRMRNTDTSGRRTTPASAYTDDHYLILAITTGRGQARGEVGIAAIDLLYPNMILCQMSDQNSYINALTKIHMFQPIEILMPDTMGKDRNDPNSLYNEIKSRFPEIEITEISRIHWNASTGLERIKTHCVNEFSAIELIVNQKYYALSAVCVLFKYIESIQHIVYTQNSVKFEYQVAQNATMIDLDSAQNLELVTCHGNKPNFSLLGALDRCSTPAGRRLLRASILEPPCNEPLIKERQDCIEELIMNKSLHAIIHSAIRRLYRTNRLLNFVTQKSFIQAQNIETIECAERNLNYALLLKNTLDVIPELKIALQTAESRYFKEVCDNLNNESFDKMKIEILEVIHPDAQAVNGFVSSNYQRCFAIKAGLSDGLDTARQTYCEMIDDMQTIVEALGDKHNLGLNLACSSNLGYHIEMKLPKNFRFNVDELSDDFIEGHVKSGTLYMTTQDLFVRNQHAKDACIELHLMSNVVLRHMFEKIQKHTGCLFQLNDHIAGIDVILSLAEISSIPNYIRPTFGANLDVKNGKHPVMDILGQESPTPNDIVASAAYNLHTISGPNMSGKTIYLKQIVLLHIMAQIGCFVPATSARFRIIDHIFCRIGVRDDIEFNASSFVLEIKEVQYILQSLTSKSLVVLDELCRSTTVEEGASIAWAVCKRLLLSNAFTFQATHFEYLKKLAYVYPNVMNHHMEAIPNVIDRPEEARLVFTHRLKKGDQRIKNYGLMLARATGLPEEILKDAEKIVNDLNSTTLNENQSQTSLDGQGKSKVKRNYEKLAEIYDKMENEGIEDEELYKLVKGLESMSYEEPPTATLETNETPKQSSGLYSAGPRSNSTIHSNLKQSDSVKTTPQKTSKSASDDPRVLNTVVKRRGGSSAVSEPRAKVPRIEPVRSPLKPMNSSSQNQKNPQFKIPQIPFLKKNLTNDPESPMFIPRSQVTGELQKMATRESTSSSTSESSGKLSRINSQFNNFSKLREKSPRIGTLSELQSLTPRAGPSVCKRSKILEEVPESFRHYFPTMNARASQDERKLSGLMGQELPQQSDEETIPPVPNYLKPVGSNCYFPEEYRHLRHLVKNIYDEKEETQVNSPVQCNQYYFMSNTIKKNLSSVDDSDDANVIQKEKSRASPPRSPPVTKVDLLGDINEEIINLISGSENEEDRAFSECSMTSIEARITVQRREAEIFKQIENEFYEPSDEYS